MSRPRTRPFDVEESIRRLRPNARWKQFDASPAERHYLRHPEHFTPEYAAVLRRRLRKKAEHAAIFLEEVAKVGLVCFIANMPCPDHRAEALGLYVNSCDRWKRLQTVRNEHLEAGR